MSALLLSLVCLLPPLEELRGAEVLARSGRLEEAGQVYQRLAAHPDLARSAAFWFNFGQLQSLAGEEAGAIASFRRSLCLGGPAAPRAWLGLETARRKVAGTLAPPEASSTRVAAALLLLQFHELVRAALLVLFALAVSGWVFLPALPLVWRGAARCGLAFLTACLAGGLILLAGFTPPELRDQRGTWVVVREPVQARQGNGLSYPAVGKGPIPAGTEGWLRSERPNGWVQVEWSGGTLAWIPKGSVLLGP